MRTKSLFSPYLKFELLAGSPLRAVKVPDVTGDSTRRPSPNFLVSGWLAGFQTLSLQGMTAKGCAAKKKSSFAEQSASLCDPPHPSGNKLWALPPFFACREAGENVLSQFWHRSQKSRLKCNLYIYTNFNYFFKHLCKIYVCES